AKRDGERAAKPTRAPKSATAEESGLTLGDIVDATVTPASPALVMQYPLRENFAAQVVLPRNLTLDEARRLCAFIRTLAADFTPPPDS
ncbi:MAG: hypothetical protein ACREVC_03520, partial [Burkholderiales bacterium]